MRFCFSSFFRIHRVSATDKGGGNQSYTSGSQRKDSEGADNSEAKASQHDGRDEQYGLGRSSAYGVYQVGH